MWAVWNVEEIRGGGGGRKKKKRERKKERNKCIINIDVNNKKGENENWKLEKRKNEREKN